MSAQPDLLSGPGVADWSVWTTQARLVVTDPRLVDRARQMTCEVLDEVDLAASRFRSDSEIARIAERTDGRMVLISPLLAKLVAVALDAARLTDGDVDPTVGATLADLGYDRDLDDVRADVNRGYDRGLGYDRALGYDHLVDDSAVGRRDERGRVGRGPMAGGASARSSLPCPRPTTWRSVRLEGRLLTVPAGVVLDLGATAKAYAADTCAVRIAERLGCGAMVSLGGDLRVSGPAPDGGWGVLVHDGPTEPASRIQLDGAQAVATSSTLHRTWHLDGKLLHHILDPRTGRPARPVWRTATVAADTCVAANTLATAAIIRGPRALELLERAGVAARLVAADGSVVRLGGWPA